MSHRHDHIICPNCGFHTSENFCARCGQETHLHKETFWGLVMHFIGHYFHYDSKFWQTIKALWFSPGKLTIAYWNKQRMRYIPPISLYIFISAVFFLVSYATGNGRFAAARAGEEKKRPGADFQVTKSNTDKYTSTTLSGRFGDFMDKKAEKIKAKYGDVNEFVNEKISHNIPKLFFFMIPVMAIILKLLFLRRKDALFVDHAIFSLHYHALWFSLFIISLFSMPDPMAQVLRALLLILAGAYMVVALHRVYIIGWGRALLYAFTIGLIYIIVLVTVFLADLFLIVAIA